MARARRRAGQAGPTSRRRVAARYRAASANNPRSAVERGHGRCRPGRAGCSRLERAIEVVRNGCVESIHPGGRPARAPDGAEVRSGRRRAGVPPVVAQAAAGGGDARGRLHRRGTPRSRWPRRARRRAVHVAGARATLAAAGLNESALQCPPELPDRARRADRLGRAGGVPAAISQTARASTRRWWQPASRRAGRSTAIGIRRIRCSRRSALGSGRSPAPVSGDVVDGCGAPAFAGSAARAGAGVRQAGHGDRGSAGAGRQRDARFPLLIGGRAIGQPADRRRPWTGRQGGRRGRLGRGPARRPGVRGQVDDGGARALPPLLAAALRHWGFDSRSGRAVGARRRCSAAAAGGRA